MRTPSVTKENIAPRIVCTVAWRLAKVTPLAHYTLEVEFIDGTCGLVEMQQRITSNKAGVFAKLKDLTIFNQVYLEYGAVTWPDGIDLAPDAMYDEIKQHGVWILS